MWTCNVSSLLKNVRVWFYTGKKLGLVSKSSKKPNTSGTLVYSITVFFVIDTKTGHTMSKFHKHGGVHVWSMLGF